MAKRENSIACPSAGVCVRKCPCKGHKIGSEGGLFGRMKRDRVKFPRKFQLVSSLKLLSDDKEECGKVPGGPPPGYPLRNSRGRAKLPLKKGQRVFSSLVNAALRQIHTFLGISQCRVSVLNTKAAACLEEAKLSLTD